MKQSKITGYDGYMLSLRTWDQVEAPRGVVQLFHGMAEHISRYDEFARYLNKEGYVVVGHDHRGHGHSKKSDLPLGYLGPDGFNRVVDEGFLVTDHIKKKYPGKKLYLFAHSFGSFVGQKYACRYGDHLDGMILSGSAMKQGLDISLGRHLGNFHKILFTDKKPARFLDKVSFMTFNNKFKPARTDFDWLSTDSAQVDKYIGDPLCGYLCPINFFVELARGLSDLYNKKDLAKLPKTLPILMIAGQDDPVSNYGKTLEKLKDLYQDLGLERVDLTLYQGCRHELVNETIKGQVFERVGKWLKSSDENLL